MIEGQSLEESQSAASDKSKVIRLIDFLTRLAFLRAKVRRDVGEYFNVLWLNDIPREKGCFTQAWG